MSLFSFSRNKNQEEVSFVFHIGSGSISGYIVKFSQISRPKIIYSTTAPILFQKNINQEKYFKFMIKSFDSVVKDIQKKGIPHLNFTGLKHYGIKKVFYILSSPWCVSQTKLIKIKKDKPFEVNRDSIEDFIKKQEEGFLANDSSEGSKIIERKIIEAKLNGYKMTEIYGKKTKDIELSFFMTSSPEYVLKELKNTIRKYFNIRSHYFYSFALSSFSMIRDIYSDKKNFIYLDVHEELTDLSIVKDDIFAESVSFPMGKNFFIRHLSEYMRISADEARSMINLCAENKCDNSTSQKVNATINIALKSWLDNFHFVLTSLSLKMCLPKILFIMSSDELDVFLIKEIKKERFSQFSMTDELFDVIMLNNKNFDDRCDSDKNFKNDPFAKVECLFLNKIFNLK